MIKVLLPILALVAWGFIYLLQPEPPAQTESTGWVPVVEGALENWVRYEGTLQSRDEQNIHSRLSRAIITELAPEGVRVQAGDLLVAFDRHELQREVFKLEEAFVLAEAEYESLVKAELPLKEAELESALKQVTAELTSETRFLEDSKKLAEKGLVSDRELSRQHAAVERVREQVAASEKRLALTREFVQPSILRRGQATLKAARQQRDLAKEQLAQCRLTADRAGTVVYQPLHLDGSYRTVKVGDTVFRNQRFLLLADMSKLVVTCEVPEAQLSDVSEGSLCEVTPAAFPGLRIPGAVEQIGTMAHSLAGRPSWQKFFTVAIRLEQSDPRLRSGMSVYARVRSLYQEQALLVPRRMVTWENGSAWCLRQRGEDRERVALRTGSGNATQLEVLEGLQPGDRIRLP